MKQLRAANGYCYGVITLVFVAVHVALFGAFYGRLLEDAERYVQAGKFFLQHGQIDPHFHVFYLIPIAFLGAFTRMADDPRLLFVIFQSLVSLLAVWALFRLTQELKSQRAAIFASMFIVLWIDNIRWDVITMTESLFGSFVIFVVFMLTFYRQTPAFILMLLSLLTAACLTRPTGLLLLIAAGSFFIHRYLHHAQRSKRATTIGLVVLGLLFFCAAVVLSRTWDFTPQYFRGNIVTYADTYAGEKSLLQIDPRYTYPGESDDHPMIKGLHFVISRPLHVLTVSALKLFYLATGFRPYYSCAHNVFNILWAIMIYVGLVFGVRSMRVSPLKTSLITLIVGNFALVGVSTVDWDNRFYIPMEAAIVVFSAIGWDVLFEKAKRNRSGSL